MHLSKKGLLLSECSAQQSLVLSGLSDITGHKDYLFGVQWYDAAFKYLVTRLRRRFVFDDDKPFLIKLTWILASWSVKDLIFRRISETFFIGSVVVTIIPKCSKVF